MGVFGYSDCVYCQHYNKYRNCDMREEVEKKLLGDIMDGEIVDQFLSGKRKVKSLVNGKKEVECPCYKFSPDKCVEPKESLIKI